jgi:signal transduction histidine kinase
VRFECRFYAGSPLITSDGKTVGVFAVLDSTPHLPFTERESALLELMAATTVKQLEARKHLIQANRMKDTFVANMSHELRSPLHGIIGVMSLLSSTPLSAVQREYVSDCQQQATLLLNIVKDLLDYSKLQADRVRLDFTSVPLQEYLRSIVRQLQVLASLRCITIELEMWDIGPGRLVTMDQHRVSQILTNLISQTNNEQAHDAKMR